jgi:hypothetical protein
VSNSYDLDAGFYELLMLLGQLPKLPPAEGSSEAPHKHQDHAALSSILAQRDVHSRGCGKGKVQCR